MSGSVGMAVGSEPLYGTACRRSTASSGRSNRRPTVSACFLVNCIWPRHAAVVHSLDWPTFCATSVHLMPFFSLRKTMRSVTSSRLIGLISAVMSGSRFKLLLLRIQLLVDGVRDLQELVLADVAGRKRIAHLAVDPVEHAHLAFFGVAERALPVAGDIGAHIQRDARALLRLIHEVCDRARVARKEPAAPQAVAALLKLRRTQRRAEALGEPRDQVRLLV